MAQPVGVSGSKSTTKNLSQPAQTKKRIDQKNQVLKQLLKVMFFSMARKQTKKNNLNVFLVKQRANQSKNWNVFLD